MYEPLVRRWCRRMGLEEASAADVSQRVERPVEVGFHLTDEMEERTGLDPYVDSGGIFLRGYDERGAEFLGATGYVWRLDWTDINTPWIVPPTPGRVVQ